MTDNRAPAAKADSRVGKDAAVRKMIFRTYALCSFTMVFCVNAPAPLFELFRVANGLGPSELAMLYSVYAGIVILALPGFGWLSDRLGRRPLVALGLGFIAIGSLVLAVADSFLWLIGGRLLQGLGVAAMSAPAACALSELVGSQRQASAASTVAVALAAGGASAPLFAGVAAEAFPAFPTFPLLACAGMALAGSLSVALLPDPWRLQQLRSALPHSPRPALVMADAGLLDAADATDGSSIGDLGSRRGFWQACATVVACFGAQATFFTVSGPIFGALQTSHVLLTAGCAMSALMIASCLGGMLARRLGGAVAIASGMALLAPGVCGFFGLIGLVPLLALSPAIAAIGLGHGLGYAGAMRLINETAHSTRRAAYTSKFYIAIYIGGGLPVLVLGLLEGSIGRPAAGVVFSVVIAGVAIGVLTSQRPNSGRESWTAQQTVSQTNSHVDTPDFQRRRHLSRRRTRLGSGAGFSD